MSIRFFHTSDWHIGTTFHNHDHYEGISDYIRDSRTETVGKIAQNAEEDKVAFILVAGDVFANDSVGDGFISSLLDSMGKYRGKWIMLPGNHDKYQGNRGVWYRFKKEIDRKGFDNILIVSESSPIPLEECSVTVLPAPRRYTHEAGDTTAWFNDGESREGYFRIGLAHGSVDSVPGGIIKKTRAEEAKLDYLALGDWHDFNEVNERTYYPGTHEFIPPAKKDYFHGGYLDISIASPKAMPSVKQVPVGKYFWHSVDCKIYDNPDEINKCLDSKRPKIAEKDSIVKINLSGSINLSNKKVVDDILKEKKSQFACLIAPPDELTVAPTPDELENKEWGRLFKDVAKELKDDYEKAEKEDDKKMINRALLMLIDEWENADRGIKERE